MLYIAMNKYSGIRIFHHEPRRSDDRWVCGILGNDEGYCVDADTEAMFKSLKWSDEPVMVKIAIPMEWYIAQASHHTQG